MEVITRTSENNYRKKKKNTEDFQKIIHFQFAQQKPVNCCVNLYTAAGTVKPLRKAASHKILARHIWHVE